MARTTANFWDKRSPYENWIESSGVPIHRGYYIEDCRGVDLAYWPERECDAGRGLPKPGLRMELQGSQGKLR
jgi:hypothetical protein